MSFMMKRSYSSSFGTIKSPLFFKFNRNNKRRERESLQKPNTQEENLDNQTKLENDFVSADLLSLCSSRESEKNIQADNETELLYGIYPVLLAIKSNHRSFFNVYFKENSLKKNIKLQEINELCKKQNILTTYTNKKKFLHLLGAENVHQGVCLEASKLPLLIYDNYTEDEKSNMFMDSINKSQLWLYLDQVNDPMNFGAILRSAYYFGVSKVFTSATDSCPITSTVSKASSGVAEILPIYRVINIEDFLHNLRSNEWQIVSSTSHSSQALPLDRFKGTKKMLLIVGNEGRGVSPVVERNSDVKITIPSSADCVEEVQSLNVSVATAVILHSLSLKMQCNSEQSELIQH